MRHTQYHGVTLLEIMVALALSMLMTLLLTKIFLTMHHASASQRALDIQQNNAQILTAIISEEIAMAGYIGCSRISGEFKVLPLPPYSLTAENYLDVGADTITVRYQSFPGVTLLKDMRDKNILVTDASVRYRSGQTMIISDCAHAEIFQAGVVAVKGDKQIIYSSMPLRHQYHQYAEVGSLVIHHYKLVKSHHFSVLQRQDADGRKVDLIEGIDGLKFEKERSGVRIHFQTTSGKTRLSWHGYAAMKNEV